MYLLPTLYQRWPRTTALCSDTALHVGGSQLTVDAKELACGGDIDLAVEERRAAAFGDAEGDGGTSVAAGRLEF